jgi:hypothetical protein
VIQVLVRMLGHVQIQVMTIQHRVRLQELVAEVAIVIQVLVRILVLVVTVVSMIQPLAIPLEYAAVEVILIRIAV